MLISPERRRRPSWGGESLLAGSEPRDTSGTYTERLVWDDNPGGSEASSATTRGRGMDSACQVEANAAGGAAD